MLFFVYDIIPVTKEGIIMVAHDYERTGIKEKKNLRESREQLSKRKRREENLQITKERTAYREDVEKKYDTGLMNRSKECQKIENLLEDYYEKSSMDITCNTYQLVQGYQDYFSSYGENMTTLELRTFRKAIAKTLSISNAQSLLASQSMEEIETASSLACAQEEAILDFCVEHYECLTTSGLNSLELTGFLLNAGTPIQNIENLKEAKTKVMTLLDGKGNTSK